MTKNLVIVESPAKAKTINKYLGANFNVIASMGHIRDLSPKEGSVLPDDDFAVVWEVGLRAKKNIQLILQNCKNIDNLYLATDPDREGEAISWHIVEILKEAGIYKKIPAVHRIMFHEITKNAVQNAIQNPRQIDNDLVDAYLARRALDYLVGYTLSPVLWRKLPSTKSAGRVQSAALRIICEREMEINKFIKEEYWSLPASVRVKNGSFLAKLSHINGEKLDVKAIKTQKQAINLQNQINDAEFAITNIEKKHSKRNPFAPFTTSTLQQEASRKLGFSTQKTMQIAQKLYEGIEINGENIGLITYMRTDSISVGMDAIKNARQLISSHFGDKYLPDSPRIYKTKSKNAQEAHEAIRPTDISRRPDGLIGALDNDSFRLYRLIWNRLVASQMSPADIDTTIVYLSDNQQKLTLSASGNIIKFDGFLVLYREEKDSDDSSEDEGVLPIINEGERAQIDHCEAKQHFTEPPARYNEASLVKKLEEVGIGRPSTYATIIKVLQEREYVNLENRRFIPQTKGLILSQFLTEYFDKFFNTKFTADMEDKLDDVSNGEMAWKKLLSVFWAEFNGIIKESSQLQFADIRAKIDGAIGDIFIKNRICPSCNGGKLSLNIGKFGPYISCSNYPKCAYKANIGVGNENNTDSEHGGESEYPKILGNDENGLEISLKKGPYGVYVQREANKAQDGAKAKPKNVGIPKIIPLNSVSLQVALTLLSLPRLVGINPNNNEEIFADFGKFGPFLKQASQYFNLKTDNPLEIGLNRAMEIISTAPVKESVPATEIGEHPSGGKIYLKSGRFGPYVQHGKIFASLPKGTSTATLAEAIALIAKKAPASASKTPSIAKKAPAKKSAIDTTTKNIVKARPKPKASTKK